MAKIAIIITRTKTGQPVYFEKTDTERFAEANMRYFDTVREAVEFVKSVRSGWVHSDAGEFTGPITRNHLSARFYNVYADVVAQAGEEVRLDSLPAWMTK